MSLTWRWYTGSDYPCLSDAKAKWTVWRGHLANDGPYKAFVIDREPQKP